MNMQQKAYCSNYYDDGLSFGEGFILHVFFLVHKNYLIQSYSGSMGQEGVLT